MHWFLSCCKEELVCNITKARLYHKWRGRWYVCTSYGIVRILWCILGDSLGNGDVEYGCSLYYIGCMFSGPLEWSCKLGVRKREWDKIENPHCSLNLDTMQGTSSTN